MEIHDQVTDRCPECGAFLSREFEPRLESGKTVDYTTCKGDSHHRWKVLDLHRDRSVYHYQLMGPVNDQR